MNQPRLQKEKSILELLHQISSLACAQLQTPITSQLPPVAFEKKQLEMRNHIKKSTLEWSLAGFVLDIHINFIKVEEHQDYG